MKTGAYVVYNKVEKLFSRFPHSAPTDEIAIRVFKESLKNPKSDLSKYPEDWTLFKVGQYDMVKGIIEEIEQYKVCSATDFLTPEELISKIERKEDNGK